MMKSKMKNFYKVLAATGVFSLAAVLGSTATNALWSDRESTNLSYTRAGLSTSYSINEEEPIDYRASFGFYSQNQQNIGKLWTEANSEDKLTELVSNGEMYQLIRFDMQTYGLSTFEHNGSIVLPANLYTGSIFDNVNVYAGQVETAEECTTGFNTEDTLIDPSIANTISTSVDKVYSNDSTTSYICVGYTMQEVGSPGTHTNTVLVTGDSEVGNVQSTDTWTGNVTTIMPGMDQLGQYIESDAARLSESAEVIRTSIRSDGLEFDMDTHEPSTTFPNYSEGQPVYSPEEGE